MPKEGLSEIRLLVEKLKRKGIAIPEAEKEIKNYMKRRVMIVALHFIIL